MEYLLETQKKDDATAREALETLVLESHGYFTLVLRNLGVKKKKK